MSACEDWIAYHGLSKPVDDPMAYGFGGLDTHPEGVHLGSLGQARMRAYPGAQILKVKVRGSHLSKAPLRVKERGQDWSAITKRHARAGADALVYLNRHEGMTLELWERLDKVLARKGGWDSFDRMSDAALRKLAPELEDSWIILDPDLVEVVGFFTYEQAQAEISRATEPESQISGPRP
jgi:hypothetical protein